MVIRDVLEAIKMVFGKKMYRKYCTLSQTDYSRIDKSIKKPIAEEKYLERPFAYEFYHQLRESMDSGNVDFGGPIIQAEVDKRYQHCFTTGKIPDFIIHMPNNRPNLAVIEFKLATNLGSLEHDFEKLAEFKTNENLEYTYAIEVIIGSENSLKNAKERISGLNRPQGEEIIIIEFDTDSWRVTESRIRY